MAAPAIKAAPPLWYGLALLVDLVFAYGVVYSLPPAVLQVLSATVQRGVLATALFAVVMYCGVLPEHSTLRKRLVAVRAELSLIACILALAHCVNYLNSYLAVLLGNTGVIQANQFASLAIALVLLALLVVLGATSIKALKSCMNASTWKAIQRSSYVFFALIYVHELLILIPSAAKGQGEALATLTVSGMVFVAYFVLRLAKHLADRRRATGRSQGGLEEEVCRVRIDRA